MSAVLDGVGGSWDVAPSKRSTAIQRVVHDGSVTIPPVRWIDGDPPASQTKASASLQVTPRWYAVAGAGARFSVLPTMLDVRQRWFSRRALRLHLTVVLIVPACLFAAWWQATRALDGNTLSWFYSVEWPAIAIFAIAAWWHLIHEDPEAYRARKQRPPEWDDLESSSDR